MLIIHFPLFWRLRVDRLKRSVDQCGRKTFYAFTKRKRIRVDGASKIRIINACVLTIKMTMCTKLVKSARESAEKMLMV